MKYFVLFVCILSHLDVAHMRSWVHTECLIAIPDEMMQINAGMSSKVSAVEVEVNENDGDESLICQNISTIEFESGRTYIIESAENKLVIDLREKILSQGNTIIVYENHGEDNQLWMARHSQYGRAFNLLTMVARNRVLREAMTFDPAQGKTVLRHLNDGVSQQWFMGKQCGDTVQILSTAPLRTQACLTQLGSGVPLELRQCEDNNRNQLWRLNMVMDPPK